MLALTLPATWLWMQGGFDAYASAFERVAGALYAALGLERAQPLARQRYVNWIPFVALVALTPGLGWRRRGLGLLGGVIALFAAHVVLNALAPYLSGGEHSYPTALALVSDALPFLLWLWIAREWIGDRLGASGSRSPTSRGRTGPGSP